MHFLVLGATGPSGVAFVETALDAGHQLTIHARSPSKLPLAIQTNTTSVTIIKGTFDDLETVRTALNTSATILVSFAGPAIPARGTAVTQFYERLYPMIRDEVRKGSCKISRVMVLSTPSFGLPGERPGWLWWFGVWVVKTFLGDAYAEVTGIGKVTTAQDVNALAWTVFRVPGLTNDVAKPVIATYIGSGSDGMALSRKSLAVWILQEIEERQWVGKCPALSNPGWFLLDQPRRLFART